LAGKAGELFNYFSTGLLIANFLAQNDLISWLLEIAEGEERTPLALTLRVLSTNMAAIHTSSMVRALDCC
jgi:hypothetical protein